MCYFFTMLQCTSCDLAFIEVGIHKKSFHDMTFLNLNCMGYVGFTFSLKFEDVGLAYVIEKYDIRGVLVMII